MTALCALVLTMGQTSVSFKRLYKMFLAINFHISLHQSLANFTIGQAGNWYVVYIEGKIGYIRKNSDSIKNVRKPDYIPIRISDKEYPDTAERTNMKERIYLQYAQLSQKIRDLPSQNCLK